MKLVIFVACALLPMALAGTCVNGTCEGGLDILNMQDLIERHWRIQKRGDAEAFVANLAPDAKFFVNGEEDNAPWTDLSFVKDLFTRVQYSRTEAVTTIGLLDKNQIMYVIDWGVTILNTFEYQTLGPWQQKVLFTDEGKIQSIHSVCDGINLSRFGALLEPNTRDNKASMLAVLEAYNTKNLDAVVASYDPYAVHFTRNMEKDLADWNKPLFLKIFFAKCEIDATLDSFADADVRASYAHITWTLKVPGDDEPIIFQDAWYITWNPDGQIAQVSSTVDYQALAALYSAIDYSAEAPQRRGPGGPGPGGPMGRAGPRPADMPDDFNANSMEPPKITDDMVAEMEKSIPPEVLAKMKKMREEAAQQS